MASYRFLLVTYIDPPRHSLFLALYVRMNDLKCTFNFYIHLFGIQSLFARPLGSPRGPSVELVGSLSVALWSCTFGVKTWDTETFMGQIPAVFMFVCIFLA